LDRRPAGKLQFGAATLTHPWPPNGCLAAVPTDLTADHAPSMALLVSVALVALAAKLYRIRRKHRLDCRSPSLQAQLVKAALELLKPLDHQRWQRQRAVASAVPWLNLFNPICFVMASISSLSVCDSQPQA
jgi:hypothetical protein